MEQTLYVQTLGTFALLYQGKLIPVEKSGTTKMMRLLLILLLAGEKGVDRSFLIDELYYGEESGEKAAGKLRVNLFRLRKFLSENGLPEGDFVIKEGSRYKWDSETVPVELDILLFRNIYRDVMENKYDIDEKIKKLRYAVHLYRGRFLPAFSDCGWILCERDVLQDLYRECRAELERLLREKEEESEFGFTYVRNVLREREKNKGACFCAKSSFLDACRIIKGRMERQGGNANLVICRILPNKKEDFGEAALKQASDRMHIAAGILRKSDFYMDAGSGRFIFLLTGKEKIDCRRVQERLEDAFHQDFEEENMKLDFSYQML